MNNNNYDPQHTGYDPYQQGASSPYAINDVPVAQGQMYQPPQPPQPRYQAPPYQQGAYPPPQGYAYQQPPYPPPPVYAPPAPVNPGKGLAIASLILGIVSIVFGVLFGGGILVSLGCGIAGVITGVKSKKASIEAGMNALGMQTGGFICSVIGLIGGIIWVLIYILYFIIIIFVPLIAMAGSSSYNY